MTNGVTRRWKVYGFDGHRQRESFNQSQSYDFSDDITGIRKIEVQNSDITGTNDYTLVIITRNTAEECWDELMGQLSDGIFENSRTGYVEEVWERQDHTEEELQPVVDNEAFEMAKGYGDEAYIAVIRERKGYAAECVEELEVE